MIIEPDVEALAVGYLDPLVLPAVSTRVPNPRPQSFVRVVLVGGAGVTGVVLSDSLLSVECWAPSSVAASLLARSAAAHFRAWEGSVAGDSFIYSVSATAPQNFPDPDTASARYVFTVTVLARALVS